VRRGVAGKVPVLVAAQQRKATSGICVAYQLQDAMHECKLSIEPDTHGKGAINDDAEPTHGIKLCGYLQQRQIGSFS